MSILINKLNYECTKCVLLIFSIGSGARRCFPCWWGPPENESKSSGLEEERSSRALRSEMEGRVFHFGK